MEDKGTYSVDIDITDLLPKVRAISERFNLEIEGFYAALKTLVDEGDPEAMTIFLQIHEGMIIKLGLAIEHENASWFNQHITGNA